MLLVGVVAVTPALGALWYESYELADEAAKKGDWPEVVRQINLALEKKGASDARARTYGMNYVSYFPYYKLGVAYYNLGRLDAAIQAFETEASLGAIAQVAEEQTAMEQMRRQIVAAREQASSAERERVAGIVSDSLSRARALEATGDLDGALAAVDEALAVAADHPEAGSTRERLLGALRNRQEQNDRGQRVARLVQSGRDDMAAGRLADAASSFRQALDLQDDAEVRGLLDQAQGALRDRLAADRSEQQRTAEIAQGLRDAEAAKSRGDVAAALSQLQTVLALDAGNRQALDLQAELLRLQGDRDREGQIGDLLAKAAEYASNNDFRQALTVANRVLALDPSNQTATGYITRAYGSLSRQLLGRNLAPILAFFPPDPDKLRDLGDGLSAEVMSTPELLLAGNVLDEGAVIVEFFIGETSIGRGTSRVRELPQGILSTDFTLRYSMSPGLSFRRRQLTTITAVAIDEEQAESREDYTVLYIVPIYRSLWLYSGLAAAMLLIGAVAQARRVGARNRKLTRRFNPYVAGAPVMQDERFFGREALMTRVLQTVHHNSILLYGERRIGKTSFQHGLKRRLETLQDPTYRFFPVYIDLQGTPQEIFFAHLAEDIFQQLAPVLDGFRPNPTLAEPTTYQYREFVRDLDAVLEILSKECDRQVKLVLLIDEVDELNDYDPRVNQRLRSLFMRNFSENLVAVVSGVAIKKRWESEGSPWYNFFEEIPVTAFDRKAAVALIETPIEGTFKLDPGVTDKIIELTDCKPYLIQKLCIAVVNRLHERGGRRITVGDVEAIGRPEGTEGAQGAA